MGNCITKLILLNDIYLFQKFSKFTRIFIVDFMKSKTSWKKISFEKTIKSLHAWVTSYAFHSLLILLSNFLSKPTFNSVTSTYSSPAEQINQIVFPDGGRPIQPPMLAILVQIFLLDAIFVSLYFFLNRIQKRQYNLYALFIIAFVTTLSLIAYSRLVAVTVMRTPAL